MDTPITNPGNSATKEVHSYKGTRITYHSTKAFSDIEKSLFKDIGTTPAFKIFLDSITSTTTIDDCTAAVNGILGPHGQIYFTHLNHTAWLQVFKFPIMASPANGSQDHQVDYNRGILRVLVGNPLQAKEILQYDLFAGMFSPREILILEHEDRKGTDVIFQLCSGEISITNGNQNAEKAEAVAKQLDLELNAFCQFLAN